MLSGIKWKVEALEADALITVSVDGHETKKLETGERATALITAYSAVEKLGVWCGPGATDG